MKASVCNFPRFLILPLIPKCRLNESRQCYASVIQGLGILKSVIEICFYQKNWECRKFHVDCQGAPYTHVNNVWLFSINVRFVTVQNWHRNHSIPTVAAHQTGLSVPLMHSCVSTRMFVSLSNLHHLQYYRSVKLNFILYVQNISHWLTTVFPTLAGTRIPHDVCRVHAQQTWRNEHVQIIFSWFIDYTNCFAVEKDPVLQLIMKWWISFALKNW